MRALILLALLAQVPESSLGTFPLPEMVGMSGAPVRFIHPRSRVAMSGMRGVDIPVQAWIERHPDHRLFELRWQRAGEDAFQRHSKTVDGENEPSLFPDYGWLMVRLTPGEWVLTALGCTQHSDGRCTHYRVKGTTTIRICGGEDGCGADGGQT